jgi:hypothetical protein
MLLCLVPTLLYVMLQVNNTCIITLYCTATTAIKRLPHNCDYNFHTHFYTTSALLTSPRSPRL